MKMIMITDDGIECDDIEWNRMYINHTFNIVIDIFIIIIISCSHVVVINGVF